MVDSQTEVKGIDVRVSGNVLTDPIIEKSLNAIVQSLLIQTIELSLKPAN